MRGNDTSGAASVMPIKRPVSSCGKNPFGTRTVRSAVKPTVASVTRSVVRWCASTQTRPRS